MRTSSLVCLQSRPGCSNWRPIGDILQRHEWCAFKFVHGISWGLKIKVWTVWTSPLSTAWGVWLWSLGSAHHSAFRDPVDAQQEQGSLDQRHAPRDALGLAAPPAQAAGNGRGAGVQFQVFRVLECLGVFGNCGCLTWWYMMFSILGLWYFRGADSTNFCTLMIITVLYFESKRKTLSGNGKRAFPPRNRRWTGDEKCNVVGFAQQRLLLGDLEWHGEALSKSPRRVAKEKDTKLKLEERLGHMLAAFLSLGALNSTGIWWFMKQGAGWGWCSLWLKKIYLSFIWICGLSMVHEGSACHWLRRCGSYVPCLPSMLSR